MILFCTLATLIVLVGLLGVLDRRVRRGPPSTASLRFVIPCYNDAATIGETVASIRAAAGPDSRILVVDDGSAPAEQEALRSLAAELEFDLALNRRNRGKAVALNEAAARLGSELIAFVDADVRINQQGLNDALARIADESVGAVSCPFRPINRGLIPWMQQIEYNVMRFIHGSYNLGSAIALWGGFAVVRRRAFEEAGGFSPEAIVEDKDLAFKLNRSGWRVQQSFRCMETYVPHTLAAWLRQKVRWSSGGVQCYAKHWRVWIRNPLHMLFVSLYFGAFGIRIWEVVDGVALWEAVFDYYGLLNETLPLADSVRWTYRLYGPPIREELWEGLAYLGLSVPFVLPMLKSGRHLPLLLLFLPFSLFYVPAFSIVSVYGFLLFLRRARGLRAGARAW